MIRGSELAIAIAHKTRLITRRIYQRINDRVSGTSIYSINPSIAGSSLPFVGDESRVDLVDLIELKHRCILIKNPDLW